MTDTFGVFESQHWSDSSDISTGTSCSPADRLPTSIEPDSSDSEIPSSALDAPAIITLKLGDAKLSESPLLRFSTARLSTETV